MQSSLAALPGGRGRTSSQHPTFFTQQVTRPPPVPIVPGWPFFSQPKNPMTPLSTRSVRVTAVPGAIGDADDEARREAPLRFVRQF